MKATKSWWLHLALKEFQLLKEYQPDLIVLDINMPGMNGFQDSKIAQAA